MLKSKFSENVHNRNAILNQLAIKEVSQNQYSKTMHLENAYEVNEEDCHDDDGGPNTQRRIFKSAERSVKRFNNNNYS